MKFTIILLPAPQPAATVDGVLHLSQKLMKKIHAIEFIKMRDLLPEKWLGSLEEGDSAE